MMSAAWMRASSELRARWRPWLAIALMIGSASGVVMAAAAGARRSDRAVGRFLAYSRATHADVEADPSQFHAIAALPEVESAGAQAFMLMGKASADSVDTRFSVSVISLTDPALVGPRLILAAGRRFDIGDPGEAMINQSMMKTLGFLRRQISMTIAAGLDRRGDSPDLRNPSRRRGRTLDLADVRRSTRGSPRPERPRGPAADRDSGDAPPRQLHRSLPSTERRKDPPGVGAEERRVDMAARMTEARMRCHDG